MSKYQISYTDVVKYVITASPPDEVALLNEDVFALLNEDGSTLLNE